MRTFIAVDLEESLKKTIIDFIKEIDPKNKSIRWVKPDGMHLTLKFLGEIDKEKAETIKYRLREILQNYNPFKIRLIGTGTFPPNSRHPRVLWVGVAADKIIYNIQNEIEDEMAKIGFSREKRKYSPHLTLGRVKIQKGISSVLDNLDKKKDHFFGEMEVNKIIFFQSLLLPTGAKYTPLEEYKLQ